MVTLELRLAFYGARGLPRMRVDQAVVVSAALSGQTRSTGPSLRRGDNDVVWHGSDSILSWHLEEAEWQRIKAVAPNLPLRLIMGPIVKHLGSSSETPLGVTMLDLRALQPRIASVDEHAVPQWLPLQGMSNTAAVHVAATIVRIAASAPQVKPLHAMPPSLHGNGPRSVADHALEPLARRRPAAVSPSPYAAAVQSAPRPASAVVNVDLQSNSVEPSDALPLSVLLARAGHAPVSTQSSEAQHTFSLSVSLPRLTVHALAGQLPANTPPPAWLSYKFLGVLVQSDQFPLPTAEAGRQPPPAVELRPYRDSFTLRGTPSELRAWLALLSRAPLRVLLCTNGAALGVAQVSFSGLLQGLESSPQGREGSPNAFEAVGDFDFAPLQAPASSPATVPVNLAPGCTLHARLELEIVSAGAPASLADQQPSQAAAVDEAAAPPQPVRFQRRPSSSSRQRQVALSEASRLLNSSRAHALTDGGLPPAAAATPARPQLQPAPTGRGRDRTTARGARSQPQPVPVASAGLLMLQPVDVEVGQVRVAAPAGASGADSGSEPSTARPTTAVVQVEYRGLFRPSQHLEPALAASHPSLRGRAQSLGLLDEPSPDSHGAHTVLQQHQCQPVDLAAPAAGEESETTPADTPASANIGEVLRLHVPHSFQLPSSSSPAKGPTALSSASLQVPPFGDVIVTAVFTGEDSEGLVVTHICSGSVSASALTALATLRHDEVEMQHSESSSRGGEPASVPPRVLVLPLHETGDAQSSRSQFAATVTLLVTPTLPPGLSASLPMVAAPQTSAADASAVLGDLSRTAISTAVQTDGDAAAHAAPQSVSEAARQLPRGYALPSAGSFVTAALQATGEGVGGAGSEFESGGTGSGVRGPGDHTPAVVPPAAAAAAAGVPPGENRAAVDAAHAQAASLVAALVEQERRSLQTWAQGRRDEMERAWRAAFEAREAQRMAELEASAAAKEAARQAAAQTAAASVAAVESRLRKLLVAAEAAARDAEAEKSEASASARRSKADSEQASSLAAQRASAADSRAAALQAELQAARGRVGELEDAFHALRLRAAASAVGGGTGGDATQASQSFQQLNSSVGGGGGGLDSTVASILTLAGQLAEARAVGDVAERDRDALRLQVARLAAEVTRLRGMATGPPPPYPPPPAPFAPQRHDQSVSLNGTLHDTSAAAGSMHDRLHVAWRASERRFGLSGDPGELRDIAAQAGSLLRSEASLLNASFASSVSAAAGRGWGASLASMPLALAPPPSLPPRVDTSTSGRPNSAMSAFPGSASLSTSPESSGLGRGAGGSSSSSAHATSTSLQGAGMAISPTSAAGGNGLGPRPATASSSATGITGLPTPQARTANPPQPAAFQLRSPASLRSASVDTRTPALAYRPRQR